MRMLLRSVVFGCLMLMGTQLCSASPDLAEAERLIVNGQAESAYNMLQPYEFERSGDIQFDYLFGLAALESGRADKATLAFERVLIQKPNFLGARLDLARAWFALNLYDLAKDELEKLQTLDPPPSAQKAIDKYLSLIEQRSAESANGFLFSGYIEGRVGRDTNVNASPGNASIFIPAFGGNITLNGDSVGLADSYYGVATGIKGQYRNLSGLTLYGGLEAVDKRLRKLSVYDTSDYKGSLGVSKQFDRFGYSVGIQYGRMLLNDTNYRSTSSIGFDLHWAPDPLTTLFVFEQLIFQRHNNAINSINDSDVILAGVGYARIYDEKSKSSLFASLYMGSDMSVRSRIDGDKKMVGVKGGVLHQFTSRFSGQLHGGYQYGAYDLTNALFLVARRDELYEMSAGLTWKLAKQWSFRPSVSYLISKSNVAIYHYKRGEASAALRYEF